jgi:hypothetical protein
MRAGGGEYSVCGIEPYEIGRPNLPVEQVRLRVHLRLRKIDKWRWLSVLRFKHPMCHKPTLYQLSYSSSSGTGKFSLLK